MKKKRIVITGIGVVSPIGVGKEAFWKSLKNGRLCVKPITLFDTKDYHVKEAGEITGFDPKGILGQQNLMDLDRATLLLLCAGKLGLEDARFEINSMNTRVTGVSIGTTFGSLSSISRFDQESLTEGPQWVNPSVFPSTVGNSPASRLNIKFGIKGFSSTLSTGMCAGLDSVDYACDLINLGRAQTVITGAVEDLSFQIFLGFYKLNYLSGLDNGKPVSRPFDKRRDGIVLSEGSAVLVIEELKSARARKAAIYAEIAGIGSCFDPARFYNYNPKGEGMIEAMRIALKDSGLKPKDIDCIFANANSARDADIVESKAVKAAFGKYAYKIPVTAIKSSLGETYSASGAMATAAAATALAENCVPPVIGYEEKDRDCDLDYVVGKPRHKKLNNIMINTFSPNGANTVLVLKRIKKTQ